MPINRCMEKENEVLNHLQENWCKESSGTRQADETRELERGEHLTSKMWGTGKRYK